MMATAKNKLSTDFQSAINCVPERSVLGAFGKQHHDYDHDVFNSAGSTLATPHFGPENGVHLTEPVVKAGIDAVLSHSQPVIRKKETRGRPSVTRRDHVDAWV